MSHVLFCAEPHADPAALGMVVVGRASSVGDDGVAESFGKGDVDEDVTMDVSDLTAADEILHDAAVRRTDLDALPPAHQAIDVCSVSDHGAEPMVAWRT